MNVTLIKKDGSFGNKNPFESSLNKSKANVNFFRLNPVIEKTR